MTSPNGQFGGRSRGVTPLIVNCRAPPYHCETVAGRLAFLFVAIVGFPLAIGRCDVPHSRVLVENERERHSDNFSSLLIPIGNMQNLGEQSMVCVMSWKVRKDGWIWVDFQI